MSTGSAVPPAQEEQAAGPIPVTHFVCLETADTQDGPEESNFSLIVDGFPVTRKETTVAEFVKQALMESLPTLVLKLIRRHPLMRKRVPRSRCRLAFGGGHDLLVLLDHASLPSNLEDVPSLSVWFTMNDSTMLSPQDSMLENITRLGESASNQHNLMLVVDETEYGDYQHMSTGNENIHVINMITGNGESLVEIIDLDLPFPYTQPVETPQAETATAPGADPRPEQSSGSDDDGSSSSEDESQKSEDEADHASDEEPPNKSPKKTEGKGKTPKKNNPKKRAAAGPPASPKRKKAKKVGSASKQQGKASKK